VVSALRPESRTIAETVDVFDTATEESESPVMTALADAPVKVTVLVEYSVRLPSLLMNLRVMVPAFPSA